MTPFILTAVSHMALEQKLIECGLKVPCETGFTVADGVELSYYQSQPAVSGLIPDTMDAEAIKALMGKDVDVAGTPIRAFLGQPAPDVEPVIDNLQIRLALSELGLREAVEAYVEAADQETKDWWNESLRFLKSDIRVQAAAKALGVTPEQLDGLWLLGVGVTK